MSVLSELLKGGVKGGKQAATSIMSTLRREKPLSTSREIVPYVPPVQNTVRSEWASVLRGIKPLLRPKVLIPGAVGLGVYNRLTGDNAAEAPTNVDYSTIWNPMTAAQEAARMQAGLLTQPNPQAAIDLLNQYAGRVPGAAGGAGGAGRVGGVSGGVAAQQAQAGLASAAAPTGTAVSGLTPVGGQVSAAADSLIRQGGTFDDYLNTLESFAKAAGVNMNSSTRERLRQEATRMYAQRTNVVNEQLAKIGSGLAAAQLDLSSLPPFVVDTNVINRAVADQKSAAKAGFNAPINYFIDRQSKEYYSQYLGK